MNAIDALNRGLAGRYTIERQIGAGGMAVVYLARDLRHQRLVALKVLRRELLGAVTAERFLSEIRVTANLQHPNLLPLFDSGEIDGLLFYVMPYVEGESLRHLLDREKQLPIDEAVRIAVALCGALDYAHRRGVIHRDLKPENVLLQDGQPLIADFGIALAVSNATGAGRLTETGIAVGTPQYMSPEQAAGDREIDARTDIYSMAVLTYEMIAGHAPHTATTSQAIIAKVLTEEARPLRDVRRLVPPHVDGAVHRALEKLPADRFAAAREFADALSGKVGGATWRRRARSRSLRLWITGAVALIGVSTVAFAWSTWRRPATPTVRSMLPLGLPDSMALDPTGLNRSLDLSPDGQQVAYVGQAGLFIRTLADVTPRRLTSDQAYDPTFSPDGEWVAYLSNRSLRKVRVTGGTPVPIADSVRRYAWSSKGVFVFTRGDTGLADLWRVNENSGRPERFIHQQRPTDFALGTPSFLPDGDRFLVPVQTRDAKQLPEIAVGSLSGHEMQYLGEHGNHPFYLQGTLFYVIEGTVMAVPFDASRLKKTGTAVRAFSGVFSKVSSAELAVAANGTMVYLPPKGPRQLVELERTGRVFPLPHPPGVFSGLRYSPDGRRLALSVEQPPSLEANAPSIDVWIYDVSGTTVRPLSTSHRARAPDWTRDGRRVGWSEPVIGLGMAGPEMIRKTTSWRSSDGADSVKTLVENALATAFSPTAVVCVLYDSGGAGALTVVSLDSTHRPTKIRDVRVPPAPRVSPDGHWVAYVAKTVLGADEVFVSSMNGSGAHTQISMGGGADPVWNPQGGELFYRAGIHLISVNITLRSEALVGRRDTLPFMIPGIAAPGSADYDVSPDGKRFLMLTAPGNLQPVVMTGWLDGVQKLLRRQ